MNYAYTIEPIGNLLLHRNIWKLSWEPIDAYTQESFDKYSYVGEITSISMFVETNSCLYIHSYLSNEIIVISKEPKLIAEDNYFRNTYSSGYTRFKFIYPFLEKRRGWIEVEAKEFIRYYTPELRIDHSENQILLTVFDIEEEEQRFCIGDNTKSLFDRERN